jgi:diaminopimelate epimerase
LGAGAFEADWFMDYRNADGSLAEMCGNGARVFVEFIRAAGLVDVPDGRAIRIGTRGGSRRVWCEDEDYAVELGGWTLPGGERSVARGGDVEVAVSGMRTARLGLRIDIPNPHVVVAVSPEELTGLDLTTAPLLNPAPPAGANVEFIAVDPVPGVAAGGLEGTGREGRIALRVWERGSGETKSCGTGVAAAAVAASLRLGDPPSLWRVEVPGGVLRVRLTGASAASPTDDAARQAVLVGPAVLVYQGVLVPYVSL